MAKAIEQLKGGMTIGHAMLGRHGDGPGSVAQEVHDGDTVTVELVGNLSVRFLGVDTPEVSFTLPGTDKFTAIGSPEWERFLADPFAGGPGYPPGLRAHLERRAGLLAARLHHEHAQAAREELVRLIGDDMARLGATSVSFRFFLAFAGEIMDRYGRLLAYLNCEQKDRASRPPSYNERMLRAGRAFPYFIWPNVDPFRRQQSVVEAVPGSTSDPRIVDDGALARARRWVKSAREQGTGIHADPALLEPFELRFLARREQPGRWLMDLSREGSRELLAPHRYHEVLPEDRLFVPEEYLPLFTAAGWSRAA
jgi:endonuclease YncB( thermonuclease family)